MNTSITETAKTVKPGKVKVGLEYGSGVDITSTVFLKKDPLDVFDRKKIRRSSNLGFKFGKGISDGFEVNSKLWIGNGGVGLRLYTKHRLNGPYQDTNYAILPGFNYVTSEAQLFYNTSGVDVPIVTSYGFELPFMMSHKFNPHISLYGAIRYGIDFVEIDYSEVDYIETFTFHRVGLISGVSIKFDALYFRPEFGYEIAKTVNGQQHVMPNFTLGFGININK